MPTTTKAPSYRKHRAPGQAIVTLDGHDHYLGPFGTKVSRDQYDAIVGEWLSNGRRLATEDSSAFYLDDGGKDKSGPQAMASA